MQTTVIHLQLKSTALGRSGQLLPCGFSVTGCTLTSSALLARKHMVRSLVQKKAQVLAIGAEGEGPEPGEC